MGNTELELVCPSSNLPGYKSGLCQYELCDLECVIDLLCKMVIIIVSCLAVVRSEALGALSKSFVDRKNTQEKAWCIQCLLQGSCGWSN